MCVETTHFTRPFPTLLGTDFGMLKNASLEIRRMSIIGTAHRSSSFPPSLLFAM